MTDAKIDLESAEIHTISFGRGKPLVLLPGFPFPASIFLLLEPYLAPNFAVTALDLPGWMGKSKFKSPNHQGIEGYVLLLKQVLDNLYPQEAINLGGVSAGGTLALLLASRYPKKVKKVVIQSSPYTGKSIEHIFKKLVFLAQVAEKYPLLIPPMKQLYKVILFAKYQQDKFKIKKNGEIFLKSADSHNLEKEIIGSFGNLDISAAHFGLEFLNSDFADEFRRISKEVVVVGCGKDDIVPTSLMKTLAFEILPKAQYIEMKNLSHVALAENPKNFAKIILENLAG